MNKLAADEVGPAGRAIIGKSNVIIDLIVADRPERKAEVMKPVRNLYRQCIGRSAGRRAVAIRIEHAHILIVDIDADIF